MTGNKETMDLNISVEHPQPARRHPSPRASHAGRVTPKDQNDLNKPGRAESIDDNTKLDGYDNNLHVPVKRRTRTGKRRNTLSIIEKELEEAKRLIENKIDKKMHARNDLSMRKPDTDKTELRNDNLNNRSSETDTKTPYVPPDEVRPRMGTRSEKVYARYVQEGERNLMLIYEPKDSKSEVYCKQIGHKNVMVHLNVSSNLCQLIDRENKGIIPLDSEGEVWLEIKRRSQVTRRKETFSSDVTSSSENVFDESTTSMYSRVKNENEYVEENNFRRSDGSYILGKVGGCQATEDDEFVEDEEEGPYNTISITKRRNSLMIKFEKWNQHGVLNSDNLKESPILKHKKVIDFLEDEGNHFDVSICDWEYEKEESVYSYISSNLQLVDMNEDYTEIPPAVQQFRPHAKEPEENSASFGLSFDHDYDSPIDPAQPDTGLYSVVNKQAGSSDARQGKGAKDEKEYHRSKSEPSVTKRPVENSEIDSKDPHSRNSLQEHIPSVPETPSRHPIRSPKPDLTQHKWYHGKIPKSLAKDRLKGKKHGSFLVRDASDGGDPAHQYTIEFIDGGTVKKLMIMNTNCKYHFKEYVDKKFDRVDQLIHTIMSNGLEVKENNTNQWKNIKVKPISNA